MPDRIGKQDDGCDSGHQNPALGTEKPVPLAGNLFVTITGVVLVKSLVHLAVVERIINLGVLHQMLHSLV